VQQFWQIKVADDGRLGPKHVVEGNVKGKKNKIVALLTELYY
jgi:hypothetical protein